MNCRIQEIKNLKEIGRIIVVSDIHGYVHYLRGVLEKVGYTAKDTLVIVGDMIEKGPESLETVRYIMGLCEEKRVFVTMGNVEYHRLNSFYNDTQEGPVNFFQMLKWTHKKWKRGLFLDMLNELEIELEEIREEEMVGIKQQIKQRYARELEFLWNLPTVLSIGNFIFAHAGVPTEYLEELQTVDALSCMKIDAFLKKEVVFNKTVVVGHWPVCLYRDDIDCMNPIFDYQKHIIAIDGGCALKYGAQLNALIIPKPNADIREVTYMDYDDYPVMIAPNSQSARKKTIVIRYFDSEVRILEEMNDVVKLLHINSNKNFMAPKEFLFFRKDKAYCNDCSDAYLAIEQGDRLAVIAETSVGDIVKKDGVLGWYMDAERIEGGDIDS